MSRIGKKLIKIPSDVTIAFDKNNIRISGKYGQIEKTFLSFISFCQKDNELFVTREGESKFIKSYHGLCRALIQNMITGVNELFAITLIAEGIGYKFQLEENFLVLNMGYTHPIKFNIIPNLNLVLESPTKLIIKGIDKEVVGLFASNIRKIRPPEPYKGKGILYSGEKIRRKVGKK